MKIEFQIMRNCLYPINSLNSSFPSLIVKTPSRMYMFNSPEAHRRYLTQHHCRILRPMSLFFTHNSISAFGGLMIFLIQLFQRRKATTVYLYFDEKMYKYFQNNWPRLGFRILHFSYSNMFTKQSRFSFAKNSQFRQYFKSNDYWRYRGNLPNHQFTKYATQIRNASKNLHESPSNLYYDDGEMNIRYFKIMDPNTSKDYFYNYIMVPKASPPRINKQLLKQYKFNNQKTMELIRNKKVSDQSGIYKFEDFILQDSIQPNLVIFHYRSLEQLKETVSHPIFQEYLTEVKENGSQIYAVVHIISGDCGFVNESQFHEILLAMGKNIKHLIQNPIILDEKSKQSTFPAYFELSSDLHRHIPNNIPDLKQVYFNYYSKNPYILLHNLSPAYELFASKRLYQLILGPLRYQGYHQITDNRVSKLKQSIKKQPNQELLLRIKERPKKILNFDPKIIFLGTSSMISTKYRNVSGILLQIRPTDFFLFDCGDGIFNQILNHYGQLEIQRVLRSLKVIFITHLHSDHCTGILEMIEKRNSLAKSENLQKLFLVIPSNTIQWYQNYNRNINILSEHCDIVFTQTVSGMQKQELLRINDNLPKKSRSVFKKPQSECLSRSRQQERASEEKQLLQYYPSEQFKPILEGYLHNQSQILSQFHKYLEQVQIKSFLPVPVTHCPQSYGIVLQHRDKTKISYSGDCRPTKLFSKLAKNSTILIHQSTFLDNQFKLAQLYRHSTVGQALQIGIKSKSYMTALTHFSVRQTNNKQRILCPELYDLNEKRKYAQNNAFQCFDHLEFRLSELDNMPDVCKLMRELVYQNAVDTNENK